MKGRNLFVRIVALILCAVMVLGVATAAIAVFAAEPDTVAVSPETGSRSMVWVVVAVVAAVAVIVGCLVVPKIAKKK